MTRSDEQLLAATRHDPRAFGEFYARHERAIYRYCGSRLPYPVTGNGVAIDALPSRIDRADWVTPDGREQHAVFKPGPASSYRVLRAPAGTAGELPGFPGSRSVMHASSTEAWLVPRGDAVCLVVWIRGRQASGCRDATKPTVRPLVVALPGGVGGRVVVASFIDQISSFSVGPKPGIEQSASTGGLLMWTDGGEARTVRLKSTGGDVLHQAIPAGRSFVVNGDAKDLKIRPEP